MPVQRGEIYFVQLRSLDPSRFAGAPAGKASAAVLEKIEAAVRHCLGL